MFFEFFKKMPSPKGRLEKGGTQVLHIVKHILLKSFINCKELSQFLAH